MNRWRTAVSALVFGGALALWGCKKEVKPFEPVAVIPAPTGDTNFTPPEIRRSAPSQDTAKAEPGQGVASAAPTPKKPDSTPAVHATPTPAKVQKPAPAPPVAATNKVSPSVPAATAGPGEPGPVGDWVLQVSIHKTKADADAHIAKFAAEGIPAYAIPVPTDGAALAGQYWRVRVGRFTSRAAAQAFADKRLVPEGLKPWIDRKSNEARADGTP